MTITKLCSIIIDHHYYNSPVSNSLEFKLVPSKESELWIRKKKIIIKYDVNKIYLYGQYVYKEDDSLLQEFKLSFALVVSDNHFLTASNLPLKDSTEDTVSVPSTGNKKKVYYINNYNTDFSVVEDANTLTEYYWQVVQSDDTAYLQRKAFSKHSLVEKSALTFSSDIKNRFIDGENHNSLLSYYELIDETTEPPTVNRCIDVDIKGHESGHYSLEYTYDNDGADTIDRSQFYLDNTFYGLSPNVLIDLYFYDAPNIVLPKDKNFLISFYSRQSIWRCHVISKKITPQNMAIKEFESDETVATKAVYSRTLSNGENASVLEFEDVLPLKQVDAKKYVLTGESVVNLGIIDGDEEDDEEEGSNSFSIPIVSPSIENVTSVESEGSVTYYSDVYIYI